MRNYGHATRVNPGLVGCQVAYESGTEPLFKKIFKDIAKEMGVVVSFDNDAHRGFWLENLIADYRSGFEPAVVQFPGNWVTTSPLESRLQFRPGLKSFDVACEPDVQPLLDSVALKVSRGFGVHLSTRNPVHLGVLIEILCLTYYLHPHGYRLVPVGGAAAIKGAA